ncbi:MAG: hypothetical protein AAF614_08120 [Chloroflexota bacterium]
MQINKAMLTAYQNRWQMVAEVEAKEEQQTPIAQRWQKLNSLVRMAAGLGLPKKDEDAQVIVVRNRWMLLKEQYLAQPQKQAA